MRAPSSQTSYETASLAAPHESVGVASAVLAPSPGPSRPNAPGGVASTMKVRRSLSRTLPTASIASTYQRCSPANRSPPTSAEHVAPGQLTVTKGRPSTRSRYVATPVPASSVVAHVNCGRGRTT